MFTRKNLPKYFLSLQCLPKEFNNACRHRLGQNFIYTDLQCSPFIAIFIQVRRRGFKWGLIMHTCGEGEPKAWAEIIQLFWSFLKSWLDLNHHIQWQKIFKDIRKPKTWKKSLEQLFSTFLDSRQLSMTIERFVGTHVTFQGTQWVENHCLRVNKLTLSIFLNVKLSFHFVDLRKAKYLGWSKATGKCILTFLSSKTWQDNSAPIFSRIFECGGAGGGWRPDRHENKHFCN